MKPTTKSRLARDIEGKSTEEIVEIIHGREKMFCKAFNSLKKREQMFFDIAKYKTDTMKILQTQLVNAIKTITYYSSVKNGGSKLANKFLAELNKLPDKRWYYDTEQKHEH